MPNPEDLHPTEYKEGVQHGEEIWRPNKKDIVIRNPYGGQTIEGAAFYLGVCNGLEAASIKK